MGVRPIACALVCTAALAVTGCGILTANNKEMLAARQHLMAGKADDALTAISVDERDDLCAKLDRAMILASSGRPRESNAEFDRALAQIREYEDRATVSATETGAGAGSLLLNDKVLEYQGEGYEKVLVHAFKARNFLLLKDEEAARIEIMNANMRQTEERKRHQDEIDSAREAEAEGKYVEGDALNSEIDAKFSSTSAILSRLDNVYQNPFATYMSAVVYEVNGEPDAAFVDLKQSYQWTRNPVVAQDLVRVAAKANREDELAEVGLSPESTPMESGDTLVFIDNGLAPERVELKFPIPTPAGVLFAAVPMTHVVPTNLSEVEIVADDEVLGRTAMMVDIEAMSIRNLRDRYPAILVRQAIRLGSRAAAAAVAQNQVGGSAGLAIALGNTLFNAVAEQADLRAWYAAPRSIHVARVSLPDGADHVTLRMLDSAGQPFAEVEAPVERVNEKLRVVAARYVAGQTLISTPSRGLEMEASLQQ